MISVTGLAHMIMRIADKPLSIRHVSGPTGVRGRTSDNRLIARRLGWAPSQPLSAGLAATYRWIERQLQRNTLTVPATQTVGHLARGRSGRVSLPALASEAGSS
jgi:hypothetical protein